MRTGPILLAALVGCGQHAAGSDVDVSQPAPLKACAPVVRAVRPGPSPRHAPGYSLLAVGDLDGDGKPELVATASVVWPPLPGPAWVGVARGHGAQSPDAIEYPLADNTGADVPAIGDVTGDGIADVVVTQKSSNSVRVLAGAGDGTLLPGVDYPSDNAPWAIAIGDVTGDRVPDLVVGGETDVRVLRGPDFQTSTTLLSLNGAFVVALVDADGDGALDIVVGGAGLYVLLARDGYAATQVGDLEVLALTTGDVDHDGKPDLILSTAGGAGYALGHGDGTFAPVAQWQTGMGGGRLAFGDLTADGIPDVASLGDHNGVVDVAVGNADGTFQPPVQYTVGAGPLDLAIADVDHDGFNDLVTTSNDGYGFLWGSHTGALFPDHDDYVATPGGGHASEIAVGDYNEDGALDASVVGEAGDATAILLGDGTGGLCAPAASSNVRPQFWVATADLDGDGHLDLVVGENNGIGVMLGYGTGNFAPEVTYGAGQLFVGAVLDVNGDDIPDVIAPGAGGGVFLGAGDGTLSPPVDLSVGGNRLTVGDATGDGIPDIVSMSEIQSQQGYQVTWQLVVGNGDGTFGPPVTFAPNVGDGGSTIVDLDGDGHGELVIESFGELQVYSYAGGTLQLSHHLPVPDAGQAGLGPLLVTDLDGDGTLDAAFVGGQSAITIVRDILGAQHSDLWDTGNGPAQIVSARLTPQSAPWLLVPNYFSGTITVIPASE